MHFFHKWEVVTSQPMKMRRLHPFTFDLCDPNGPPEDVTQVLQRCTDCGKLKSTTLHGTWTMNDIMGGVNAEA